MRRTYQYWFGSVRLLSESKKHITHIRPDGGGYGAGAGTEDLSMIINTNNNNFIGESLIHMRSDEKLRVYPETNR